MSVVPQATPEVGGKCLSKETTLSEPVPMSTKGPPLSFMDRVLNARTVTMATKKVTGRAI